MLCAKYDYDLDIQVKQEEAFANGVSKERINIAKRMLDINCDISLIEEITTLSVEEIQEIRKEELGSRN